jgi:hypothetical protein
MAATYTIRIAALAIDASPKWLDNLLSHHSVPGVSRGRQGLERAISLDGLLAIAVIRLATSVMGVPLGRAVELARAVVAAGDGVARLDSGIEVRFPTADIERRLRERLVEAVEAAPRPTRGRPRLA